MAGEEMEVVGGVVSVVPGVVTLSAKSSITKEVCRVESSVPTKLIWMVWPLKEVRSKVCCAKPVFLFRLENVFRVERTVPEELRICNARVSNAVVVLVSAVSMCSQNVSVAAVALEAIETCCINVSVCVVP